MIPHIYDILTDTDRPATQDDLDRLQRTARAFAELSKRIKFYHSEVKLGLVLPGRAMEDIHNALMMAESTAMSLDLDPLIQQQGQIHGRHVLVVER